MPYESFKNNLINKFDIERNRIVMSNGFYRNSSIFDLEDENDKLYKKVINTFERITRDSIIDLIRNLCDKYNIYYEIKNGNYDLTLEDKKIEFKTNINLAFLNNLTSKIKSGSIPTDLNYVFLLKDSSNVRNQLFYFKDKLSDHGFIGDAILIQDLIEDWFGINERDLFLKEIENFREEMSKVIGYKITEICTAENFQKFKSTIENNLRTFKYEDICNQNLSNNISQIQMNPSDYSRIYQRFIHQKYYEVLLSDKDFAISFMTSEWLFHKYGSNGQLDNTYIVAGYLKSIEQLLWDIIFLMGENRKVIRSKGSNVNINRTNVLQNNIDITLGTLQKYVNYIRNNDIYIVNDIQSYLNDILNYWRKYMRNDYLHKDKLNDPETVKQIRNQTIYLYFLIIGSLRFNKQNLMHMSTVLPII